MPQLADITIQTLTRTMSTMDRLYLEQPDVYEDFLREICADFPLIREYLVVIRKMAEQNAEKHALARMDMTVKHLLALWVLQNDLLVPLSDPDQMQ